MRCTDVQSSNSALCVRTTAAGRDQWEALISCFVIFVPFSFPNDPKVTNSVSSIFAPYAHLFWVSALCLDLWVEQYHTMGLALSPASDCSREMLLCVLPCVYFSQAQQKALSLEQGSQSSQLLTAWFSLCVDHSLYKRSNLSNAPSRALWLLISVVPLRHSPT